MTTFAVTITITDSISLAPLRGVLVTAKDNADAVIVAQAFTTGSGAAVLALPAATYKIHIGPMAGYNPISTQTLVVSADASVGYTLGFLTIDAAGAADLCRVFGFEFLDGVPVYKRVVFATLVGLPHSVGGTLIEAGQQSTTTDTTGFWKLDLVMGQQYRISIQDAGISLVVVIPFAPLLNLSQVI